MSARLLAKPVLPSFRDLAGTPRLPSVRISVELILLSPLPQVTPHAPPPPGWPIPPPPMGQLEGREGGHSPLPLIRLRQEQSGIPGVISIGGNSLRVFSGILLLVQLALLACLPTG